MPNKGLLLALLLSLLSGCDSSTSEKASVSAVAPVASSAPSARQASRDLPALAERYAGQALRLADVAEVQRDGASTLNLTFNIPLDPEQPFAERLHLVDSVAGKVDGAWELSDNLMELRLRPLEPKRKLVLTVDGGLRGVNGQRLGKEQEHRLETRDLQPSVGFASRGSLLPTRLGEGLPVIALNVPRIDVEFFRVRQEQLPRFVSRWGRSSSLDLWESRELLKMAELVYAGRFDLQPARNTRETLWLPMAGIEPLQEPGVYLAVMRRSGQYDYSMPATLFTLSDIGLSVHRSRKALDVFAQALQGGKPLGKVHLQLLDEQGNQLAEAVSDSQGHAQLPLSKPARLLLATQDGQTSLLNLQGAALDLAEFAIGGAPALPRQFFVFGPRDLYRPGETVLLNGLLRDRDGRAGEASPIAVELWRPDQQLSRSFVWQADDSGLYQYRLPLAEEAPTGRWQLRFDLGDGQQQRYEFLVEDFLPERLALDIRGSEQPLSPQQNAEFQLSGRYLYGAPASGNRVSGQLFVRPLREAVASLPGFQFGSLTESELSQDLELEETSLDSQGEARLSIDSQWQEVRSPVQLILQASLQESGGRPLTRRLLQPVWPAERLPGLRALFDGEEVDADSQAEFEVLLADVAGNKLASDQLRVRLIREQRDYYWNHSDSDGWTQRYNERFITLSEDSLSVPAGGTAKVSVPVEWGPYRLEVQDMHSGLVSSLRFWAGYRWQDNAEGGAVRPDQVKLALDKPAYAGGDEARVTLTPPSAGKGYLLVESADGPLWWQSIEVPAEGKTFTVPISADWARHDLYLSALVVRPGERKAQVTPKRAVGLLHLPLAREQRKLALSVQAPERMRPLQPLKVRIKAQRADGSLPSEVRVLLAAVDVGILNITQYATPDPFQAFFGRKAYGLDQLDVYDQLIEVGQGRAASLAFGGDAALAGGGKRPPTSVTIVAEQSQAVRLDAQGEAELSLDIADFNGELRLMVQAWNDEEYGMAEGKTLVAAPLIAELSMPRFLAGGDRSELALDLSNLSGQAQQLEVELSADGLLQLLGNTRQRVELAAGQRLTLPLQVQAGGGFGSGTLAVRVDNLQLPGEPAAPFSRQWTLGVRPAYAAVTRQHLAVLKAAQPFELSPAQLEAFEPAGLQAVLQLSSRPPLNLGEQIRALQAYPYGCLEQTTSGLYPSLYADAKAMARLGISVEAESERQRKIELGIERLLGMQRHNGSFALWSSDGEEEYWLTAYVTDFLLRAREQGFAVPAEALQRANARLLRYLQERQLIDPHYSDSLEHSRFAVQAYAGYVLSRSQQAPLGALRSLFERRSDARSGLPLVHLAAALKAMGDAPRAEQALLASQAIRRPARDWLGDYGSELRDEALSLALREEHGLGDDLEQRLLQLSQRAVRSEYWSTQERNALFLAGRRLLDRPEGSWQVSLQAGERQRQFSPAEAGVTLQGDWLQAPWRLSQAGEQAVYQQLSLSGYPRQAPAAGGDTLSIEREYYGLDGQPLQLEQLRSGDLVLVHLAVRAEQRVPDALVVDLLPAGLELENQNLAGSSASLEDAASNLRDWQEKMQNARIRHQEYRADRYVAAVDVDSYDTTHLLYLARAVTPGRYRVPPPQVESMYRPQWQAVGKTADWLVVKGR